MKRYLILFFILSTFPFALNARGKCYCSTDVSQILDSLIERSVRYRRVVDEYDATMYAKVKLNLAKSNMFLRYIPNLGRFSRKKRAYIIESLSDIHYTAPNIYDTRIRYSCGSIPPLSSNTYSIKRLFSVNVYSETFLPNQLISPLTRSGRPYYTYTLLGTDSINYIIEIRPKYKSVQMVTGRIRLDCSNYAIRSLTLSGMVDFESFCLDIDMGNSGIEQFLPIDVKGRSVFRCFRNRIEGDFMAHITYKKVVSSIGNFHYSHGRRHHHDLTNSFSLSMSNRSRMHDFHYLDSIRPDSLTPDELRTYMDDTLRTVKTFKEDLSKSAKLQQQLLKMGMFLVNYHTYHSSQQTDRFRFSPLLSVESMDYSHSEGITYKMRLGYSHRTLNDRQFSVTPRFEYSTKLRELEGSLSMNYLYLPQLRGMFYSTISGGDRVLLRVHESQGKDDSDIYIRYKDTGVSLMHSIEPVNGLQVDFGFDFHYRYSPQESNNSFAPRLILQWTPGLYYYMQGKEKVNLRSSMPTFRFDYERGISGVFNSRSEYEREEFEILHTFSYGLRRLMGRIGCGMFSNSKNMYFIDFRNFTHKALGSDYYSSDIGGRYYLLSRNTYHSSSQYVHAQAVFETPYLFFRNSSKRISLVRRERFYLSVLQLRHQKPYVEYGYGISTHLFDVALFSKVLNGKFCDFGFRVAFEMFRDRTKL